MNDSAQFWTQNLYHRTHYCYEAQAVYRQYVIVVMSIVTSHCATVVGLKAIQFTQDDTDLSIFHEALYQS